MTRIIDADALYYKVKCECNPYGKPTIDFESGKKVLDWIEKAPTLPNPCGKPCAFERPHGEWEKYGDKIEAYDIAGHKTWGQKRKCTNCGFVKTYIEDFGFYSFCPSCSASMSANDRQVTGKLDDNTTLLYSMTNGDNFIGKEGGEK